MGKASERGRSRLGLALRVLAIGGGVLVANCSSSSMTGVRKQSDDGGAAECTPGDTRKCIGPGACAGGQQCSPSAHWNNCDCGSVLTGPGGSVSMGGSVGQGGAGGVVPTTGGFGNVGGAQTGGTGPILGDACAAFDLDKQALPVDMYIMFDQSQSMSTMVTGSNPPVMWWTVAQQALSKFVQDPAAAGIGVGIQFFPFHGLIEGSDPSSVTSSCNIQNYATPEVEIGLLPGNAGAIQTAIQNHAPTTFTPTAAALQGAIQHMQQWGPAHPSRQPAVVLVTDGFPTECTPQDPALIAQIAQAAFNGTPRIRTFVVGFQDGEALDNLGQIAQAGGTGQAYLIKDGDIGGQFVQAMFGISSTPIDCAFDVPKPTQPGQIVDLDQVWVQYSPAALGVPQTIPRLDNLGQCSSAPNGWYFDAPPPASQKIALCPQTCKTLGAGSMHIKLGCTPALTP